MDALSNIRKKREADFLNYDPLEIIKVASRIQDTRLAGEEIELSDGTTLRARDLLAHETQEAFIRGWSEWRDTPIFKKIWSHFRRADFETDIEITEDEEPTLLLAQREVNIWITYFSLRDFNDALMCIKHGEVAVEVLKRHPMIDEIVSKVTAITAESEKGKESVKSFRGEQDVPAIGTQDIRPKARPLDG